MPMTGFEEKISDVHGLTVADSLLSTRCTTPASAARPAEQEAMTSHVLAVSPTYPSHREAGLVEGRELSIVSIGCVVQEFPFVEPPAPTVVQLRTRVRRRASIDFYRREAEKNMLVAVGRKAGTVTTADGLRWNEPLICSRESFQDLQAQGCAIESEHGSGAVAKETKCQPNILGAKEGALATDGEQGVAIVSEGTKNPPVLAAAEKTMTRNSSVSTKDQRVLDIKQGSAIAIEESNIEPRSAPTKQWDQRVGGVQGSAIVAEETKNQTSLAVAKDPVCSIEGGHGSAIVAKDRDCVIEGRQCSADVAEEAVYQPSPPVAKDGECTIVVDRYSAIMAEESKYQPNSAAGKVRGFASEGKQGRAVAAPETKKQPTSAAAGETENGHSSVPDKEKTKNRPSSAAAKSVDLAGAMLPHGSGAVACWTRRRSARPGLRLPSLRTASVAPQGAFVSEGFLSLVPEPACLRPSPPVL